MGTSASAQAGGAARAWTLGELFARAGLSTPLPNTDIAISSVCDDSRAASPGACFVAVPGAKADGRQFVQDAMRRGAAAVVVEAGREGSLQGDAADLKNKHSEPATAGKPREACPAFLAVDDAREAVARLSAAFHGLSGHGSRCPKLIGVTGTNGKTTVTWMLRSIFRAAGAKAGLLGTVEYDTGEGSCAAPLTTPGPVELCRHIATARDAGVQFMSLEVSSHALDQKRTDGLEFAAAVFTNLTGDHLDYHRTLDAYFAAKRRLFERLGQQAAAVINADDPKAEQLCASTQARVIMYSTRSGASQVSARGVAAGRSGSRFTLSTPQGEVLVHLPLVGEHNISNALAAAAAAQALGIDVQSIQRGLEELGGVPGRLQRVEPEGWPFSVLVDYAHTDDALRNVLRAVRPITPGRIICLFGCGGNRDRSKRPRMAQAVEQLADVAVVTSDNPRHEDPAAIIEEILGGFGGGAASPSKALTPTLSQRERENCALTPALSQGERENGALTPSLCRFATASPSHGDSSTEGERGKAGEVIVEVDRRAAIGRALSAARPGDTVLIAGKGHENYQLVGSRVLDFDDVQVAREFLSSMGHAEQSSFNARGGAPSVHRHEVCA